MLFSFIVLFVPPLLLLSLELTPSRAYLNTEDDDLHQVVPYVLKREEVPQKLLTGSFFTDSTRHRRPRSLSEAAGQQNNAVQEQEAELFLWLPAFGKDLYLHLQRDAGFLANSFVVEERGSGSSSPSWGSTPSDQLCFYRGHVLSHNNSFASVSTCRGLIGFIQTDEDHMFIEPVNISQGTFHGQEHKVIRQKRSSEERPQVISKAPIEHCEVVSGKKSQKNTNTTEDHRGRRNAIHVTNDYTIETLIVADADMVQYHGAEAAKRFLLTVMNMVYNMFQHPTLGVKINIRVTKLVLLHNRPEKLSITHHGERSLQSFCHWQHEEYGGGKYLGNNQVPGGKDDATPVDTAVFVTRTDFCVHKDEPCDTVGIAYLGGVCSAKRKCVLAEDNGLSLAFTIAHELGHNIGMSHDDDHPECSEKSHIMSGEWVKGRNPGDLSWSSCSHDDLANFLRSKISECLLHMDPRSHNAVRLPAKLPGMHYTADEQCQILFGTNATFCKNMEHLMCAGLWCLVEGDTSCKTKLDPPLDGTECGADKWCRAGECVSKTPLPEHVDGDWSTWTSWSMCSRTCGTGAKFRQRKCDNPPPGLGGKNCLGANVEHKVCENVPCANGVPTFRDQQCQSQDRGTSKDTNLWAGAVSDEKPCALFCSPVGKDTPVLVAEKVLDGTPCGPYETDLCVNGKCQKIGCDGIIGSEAKEDRCGVCNGDGKSCKIVKGDFNHTRGTGYIEAAVIPVGARRIRVVEDKPAHSFLALKDASKRSINSDWKIELPGEFQIAGTTVRYVRRGLWEKMSAKGPTKTPLHLMVLLFHDQNYGIHYEYTIPVNSSVDKTKVGKQMEPLYIWTHSGWDTCSLQCGGGERKTIVLCSKIVNKTMTLANDSFCHQESRPLPQVRKCNIHPCQSRWETGSWGPCSSSCGKGQQRREVICIHQLQNGTYVNTRDTYCAGTKPTSVQNCEGRDCISVWEASEWSKCSTDCGRGTRHRVVTCRTVQGKCDATTRPKDKEDCENYTDCYEWKTGEWSKCSSTCGKGLQSRVVQCMHKVTGRHGDECLDTDKPPAYRQCHQETCNEKINVNTITSPRLAALTYKCTGDQWTVYCRVVQEKDLCQDMRWYQRCCQTCRDFYAKKMSHMS
ncbi:A disintegrin and metalloproteinase with thrombospondin motifs 17 isoform X2 [Protopterus annectens]|uniref:A disintegrin and metalloproteinase with thrombospondin motifs 17 isoform X2 n=1 Tax=Protopterus annectens TaxID=7888 RepID=UPI001CFBDA42|nr:A disintegrin and metalloproteinase with thrombospondin motifs 17 isoform X2 [Protopterus annectens]